MRVAETITAVACWSCGQPVAGGQPFCSACGKVQPPQNASYFTMFGLPLRLGIDVPALEKQFYRYSRKLHPDLHARASAQEQAWSLAQASLLNDAWRTLKDPLERTKYLLALTGVELSADTAKPPPDLLEEVFELNMQLEEMRQNRKMGEDDPQLRRDLEAAQGQFGGQLDAVDGRIREQWGVLDAASDNGDDAGKVAAGQALNALLQRRSYLRNLVRDVQQTLEES